MITIDVDIRSLTKDLDDLQRRQIPFAVSKALNAVAKEGQAAVRASLRSNFTINASKLAFMERLVRIRRTDWATKTKLSVTVGINQGETAAPGLGKDRSQILGRHETGGVKIAPNPLRPFFIPTDELRPGAHDLVPRSLYPSSLGIFERRTASGMQPIRSRTTKRGKVQIIGKRRTFVIDARVTADPRAWGVFQRTGPKKQDVKMLWAFRTKITVAPRLRFYETMEKTVNARMLVVLGEALDRALASAR